MLCLVHLPWGVNEPISPLVNILNVEIKTRNRPFVLSHFHTPKDGVLYPL